MRKQAIHSKQTEGQGERGRPREFDMDAVTMAAARVFWEQGYHATSIESLCNATGVLRGSLYGAIGDKHGLLIAAFNQYAEGAVSRLKQQLTSDLPPRDALRQALLHYTRVAAELNGRHGCFITNATLELLPDDDVLRPYIETTLQRIAGLLAAAVVRGQQAGAFKADLNEKAAGNFLLCIVQGLRVLGKSDLNRTELVAIVDMAMRAL